MGGANRSNAPSLQSAHQIKTGLRRRSPEIRKQKQPGKTGQNSVLGPSHVQANRNPPPPPTDALLKAHKIKAMAFSDEEAYANRSDRANYIVVRYKQYCIDACTIAKDDEFR